MQDLERDSVDTEKDIRTIPINLLDSVIKKLRSILQKETLVALVLSVSLARLKRFIPGQERQEPFFF